MLALPAADITLSSVDVQDIAQVAYLLLTTDGHAGKSYETTGPEALTMAQIAATIAEAIGKPVRYGSCSPERSTTTTRRDARLHDDGGAPTVRGPRRYTWKF